MTKTQYYTATSADGFIADQANSLDWLFVVDRSDPDRFKEFFAGVGAMCMGATTYEWVLDHDRLLEHPERWQASYGDTPCWVFSHRDLPAIPGANLHFVSGDVAPVHEAMVAAAGAANVWLVGGGELVGRFADQGRLDEIIMGVTPVFLGGGAPLLPRRLLSSQVRLARIVQDGQIAELTYELIHEPHRA
ncbi:dihydrofolate reductase family protein [Catellatospora sichuanensis]|uniref:dihydrofolate reductase family protein n=1 Tax=Catellatospora sichuanensis TaxID=1969805 RepID=UPI0011837F02|nr:dihydrofolate reductase family protein [Catellatospora sichuanensis]